MKTSKRLTGKSGITIPKDMRLHLKWKPGISLDMETTEDGALLIRPHAKRCRFCNGIDRVHPFHDICVCESCALKMKEAIL